MISPDDSILSAYLDGELDPAAARSIELAAATDPEVSDALDRLRKLKSLVTGLSRPVGPDLSDAILRRLLAEPLARRPWKDRVGLGARIAGGLAAAAMLVLLLYPRPGRPRNLEQAGRAATSGPVASRAGGIETGAHPAPSTAPAAPARPILAHSDQPAGPADRVQRDRSAESAAMETVAEAPDVARARKLLEDPHLNRVFLIADQIDRPREPELSSLIAHTTHHDFFRFTVAQGIVIDPAHPGKATVFAVVVDEGELQAFRDRLKATFPDHVEERGVNPAFALQLAEIGQVVSLPSDQAGDFSVSPSTAIAYRTDVSSDETNASSSGTPTGNGVETRPDARVGSPGPMPRPGPELANVDRRPGDQPHAEQPGRVPPAPPNAPEIVSTAGAGPLPDQVSKHAEARTAAPNNPTPPMVVLVWIAEPASG